MRPRKIDRSTGHSSHTKHGADVWVQLIGNKLQLGGTVNGCNQFGNNESADGVRTERMKSPTKKATVDAHISGCVAILRYRSKRRDEFVHAARV